MKTKTRGFTLIEMLLSVVLLGAIAGISIPVYQNFQLRSDLENAVYIISQTMYRAQILSQSMEHDSSWGVFIGNGEVTLFQGTNFTSRTQEQDEIYDINNSLTLNGLTEVVFQKFTGLPNPTGTLTINTLNNDSASLTLNSKGFVQY